jgi:hypothetical protein
MGRSPDKPSGLGYGAVVGSIPGRDPGLELSFDVCVPCFVKIIVGLDSSFPENSQYFAEVTSTV